MIKFLVNNGADVHVDNEACLRYAAYKGNTEIVKFLLDNGADVHAENDHALKWSNINGHVETYNLIKKHIENKFK
jgi:ankyrin repeat protein